MNEGGGRWGGCTKVCGILDYHNVFLLTRLMKQIPQNNADSKGLSEQDLRQQLFCIRLHIPTLNDQDHAAPICC